MTKMQFIEHALTFYDKMAQLQGCFHTIWGQLSQCILHIKGYLIMKHKAQIHEMYNLTRTFQPIVILSIHKHFCQLNPFDLKNIYLIIS